MCFFGNSMVPFEMNSQTVFLLKNFVTFLTRMFFTFIPVFWTFVIIKIGALSTILAELFKMWNIMNLEFMLQTCWKKIMNEWIWKNLKKSEWLVIDTTTASRYIPWRPRISDWLPKFATGLNMIIGCSSKSIWLTRLLFCQNGSPIGRKKEIKIFRAWKEKT